MAAAFRWIRSMSVLVALALFMSGCGPSNPDHTRTPDQASSSGSEAEKTTASASADTEASTSDGQVSAGTPTLVYYRMPG